MSTYTNKHIYIRIDDNDPSVFFKDATDYYNEMSGYTTGKRGVKNFIKFITQIMQDERLKDDLKFGDLINLLSKANLPYHTYCAMD